MEHTELQLSKAIKIIIAIVAILALILLRADRLGLPDWAELTGLILISVIGAAATIYFFRQQRWWRGATMILLIGFLWFIRYWLEPLIFNNS